MAPAGLDDAQQCMRFGETLFSVFHHVKNINSCSFHTSSSSLDLEPHFGVSSIQASDDSLVFSCSPVGLLLLLGAMAAPSDVEVLSKKKKANKYQYYGLRFPQE